MVTQVETLPHAEGFLVSEANGQRSRENVTMDSVVAALVSAGTVLATDTDGSFVPLDLAATDGTETASAILLSDFEVTGVDTEVAVIVRDAEVNAAELKWPAGASQNDIDAQTLVLKGLGIVSRLNPTTVETQTT